MGRFVLYRLSLLIIPKNDFQEQEMGKRPLWPLHHDSARKKLPRSGLVQPVINRFFLSLNLLFRVLSDKIQIGLSSNTTFILFEKIMQGFFKFSVLSALLMNQLLVIMWHFQIRPDYAEFAHRHQISLDKDSWHDLCQPYNSKGMDIMRICNIKRHMKGDIMIAVPSDIMSPFLFWRKNGRR